MFPGPVQGRNFSQFSFLLLQLQQFFPRSEDVVKEGFL